MRYLVLVSHGKLAPGLFNALGMIVGTGREDILCTSLLDGMDADTYSQNLEELIAPITIEDEVMLMGDLSSGSPLTKAVEVLDRKGVLSKAAVFGGVNLPMALAGAMADENAPLDEVAEEIIAAAQGDIKRIRLDTSDGGSDDDI